jgi:hypothetical protein
MQERINTFINTANRNAYPPEVLLIHHILDKDSVDYFIEGATGGSSPGRLYDCEGNFIEEKAPWSLLLDERDVAFNPFVVEIEIGCIKNRNACMAFCKRINSTSSMMARPIM